MSDWAAAPTGTGEISLIGLIGEHGELYCYAPAPGSECKTWCGRQARQCHNTHGHMCELSLGQAGLSQSSTYSWYDQEPGQGVGQARLDYKMCQFT